MPSKTVVDIAMSGFRLTAEDLLRASPDHELVPFDRLAATERHALAELCCNPELYGVVRPREDTGWRVVVDRDAALLWLTLREPATLPEYVLCGALDDRQQVGRMVLEGLLEVQRGGHFVTGPAVLSARPEAEDSDGVLARLSRQAVRSVAAMKLADVAEVAARLYRYWWLPWTGESSRRLGSASRVADFLGLAEGGESHRKLRSWQRIEDATSSWWFWSRLGGAAGGGRGGWAGERATYKLYVSPKPEALATALGVLVEVLLETPVQGFKVGATGPGVLRADKLVAYFEDLEDLLSCASRLGPRLAGLPVHGVPFTAEITAGGLLSWGMDPPASAKVLAAQRSQSWRVWVTQQLAAALVAAQRRPSTDRPAWRLALERLRLDGVDIDHWTPSQSIWRPSALTEVPIT